MFVFAALALCIPYDVNTFLPPAWMATVGAALLAVWALSLWLVPRLRRTRSSSDVAWVLRISRLLAVLGVMGAAAAAGWIWIQANSFQGWCFPLTTYEEAHYDLWHYNVVAQWLGPDILASAVGLVVAGGLALLATWLLKLRTYGRGSSTGSQE